MMGDENFIHTVCDVDEMKIQSAFVERFHVFRL
jgi:hypothetical protein